MAWFVIVDDTNGRLQTGAFQDPVAPTVSPPFIVLALAGNPGPGKMWDVATRTYIPRPPLVWLDRSDDIVDDPRLSTVNPGIKIQIRNVVDDVLGVERWRRDIETPNIGGVPGSNTPPE